MKILNLGCGAKTSSHPDVVNIDWSPYLRIRKNLALRVLAPIFLRGWRLERFRSLPENILVHNLSKGIPFESESVDVVYHSHMLEHLDRDRVEPFLHEIKRVLKPSGIHRIVVPDFEVLAQRYLSHFTVCDSDPDQKDKHDQLISDLIEQSVRKDAGAVRGQHGVLKFAQQLLFGDARRRGETHQWMYDRINLLLLLSQAGYTNIQVQRYDLSMVSDWGQYGLDTDDAGKQYKPGSLYVEAQK